MEVVQYSKFWEKQWFEWASYMHFPTDIVSSLLLAQQFYIYKVHWAEGELLWQTRDTVDGQNPAPVYG